MAVVFQKYSKGIQQQLQELCLSLIISPPIRHTLRPANTIWIDYDNMSLVHRSDLGVVMGCFAQNIPLQHVIE